MKLSFRGKIKARPRIKQFTVKTVGGCGRILKDRFTCYPVSKETFLEWHSVLGLSLEDTGSFMSGCLAFLVRI